MTAALLLLLPAAAFCQKAADPYAAAGALAIGTRSVVVGQKLGLAAALLDCPEDKVQKTVRRCSLPADRTARLFGSAVEEVRLNAHYEGDVVNLSAAFPASQGFAGLLQRLKAELSLAPKTEYWSDGSKLYASYIWIGGDTEVEFSRVLRGGGAGDKFRIYLSNLSGNRPLHPDDQP